MNKNLIMAIIAVFLAGVLRGESAVYAADGKMIFSESGSLVMSSSVAMQALKDLGVSGKDAADLTKFITNDQKRLEKIRSLGLTTLSGKPQEMRSSQAEVERGRPRETAPSMRASQAARQKSPVAASRRSPSPMRVDWELLDGFMRDHKDDPFAALQDLHRDNPKSARKLCPAIMDPAFYDRAKEAKVRVVHSRAMVTFCSGTVFDRESMRAPKQRSRSASPVREQVTLRPVVFPKQSESLAAQQQGLEDARAIILENADRLGTRAATEDKLKAVNAQLRRAQERYDNLVAVVIGMKDDLSGIEAFKAFSRRRAEDLPEVYINHLVSFLENEGSQLALAQETKGQIPIAHDLVAQAKDNLTNARYDLEQINREMLQFTK